MNASPATVTADAEDASDATQPTSVMTRAQSGIVYAQQLDPDNPVFALAEVVDIPGPIDVDLLSRAIVTAVAEADVLHRETAPEIAVPVIDMADSDTTDSDTRARQWIEADMAVPMQPGRTPLVFSAIVTLGENRTLWYQRYHHSILDGVGVTLVQDRVAAIYRDLASGSAISPSSFGPIEDLVELEAARCDSDAAAEDGRYWTERLAGHGGPVAIGTPTHRVAAGRIRLRSMLDEAVLSGVHRTAREASVSWPTVLVTALAVLSTRTTGENETVLALLTSNRSMSMRSTPGMVSNIVPLPVGLDTGESIALALGDVNAGLRTSAKRQRYRYEDLRRRAGTETSVTGVQVNLVLGESDLRFGTQRAEVRNLAGGPFEDMALVLDCRNGGVEIVLDFDSAGYDRSEAQAIAARYHTVVRSLISTELSDPVSALDILPAAERHRLAEFAVGRAEGAGTASRSDIDHPLALIAEHARTHPLDPAIDIGSPSGPRSTTYAALVERSDELARTLIAAGVTPGSVVGVALPRSDEMIVGVLAAWKAGAGYVPIDPAHPAERIAHILRDAQPPVVLTHSSTDAVVRASVQAAAQHSDAVTRTLRVDDPSSVGTGPVLVERPKDSDTAYVIYTSGSTGVPKGVVISHGSLRNLVGWAVDTFGSQGLSRVYCATSLCFDVSVFEIFPALAVGGTVTMGENLIELAQNGFRGSLVSGVPSAMVAVLGGDAVIEVDTVVLAGEALTDHVAERISRAVPGARIANIYGPTESTVYATAWFSDEAEYRSADAMHSADPPIGRPLSGVRAHILDRALRPVPIGTMGDLYLSGAGLADRYHRRPALTASRFVALPASTGVDVVAGERMYHTGDLAVWSESGDVRYLGRADNQVKIRGYRIETGDIATVVRAHPSVSDAVVTARTDGPGGAPRLVAYVLATESETLVDEVLDRCRSALPEYMVPSAVVPLGAFPTNVNGKLDIAALPAPVYISTTDVRSAPGTEAEEAICAAIGEVLGREVGVDDDFFGLGGDSILAISAIDKISKYGRAVTFRHFFDLRTPRRLAAASTIAGSVVDDNRTGTVPTVPMMQWWAERHGTISTFNQSVSVSLPADVTNDDLRAALRILVDNHDTLRMRVTVSAAPVAEIDPVGAGPQFELLITADTDEECAAARFLLSPPTGRMIVGVRRSPTELILIVHHLAVDGVSWHVLLDDLRSAYESISAATTPIVRPAPTSYSTWATDLTRQPLPGTAEIEKWQSIASAPSPSIVSDAFDPRVDTAARTRVDSVDLPVDLSRALLVETATATHSSTGDLLLSALVFALGQDIVLDLEGHGRGGDLDLSRTVGWFTTVHPIALAPADSVIATTSAVKTALAAIPHDGRGFGLLRYLDPVAAPILASAPASQIGFNYLGRLMQGGDWSVDALAPVPATEADVSAVHPVEITAYASSTGVLTLHVSSCSRIVDPAWITDVLNRWQQACSELVRAAALDPRLALAPSDFDVVELDTEELETVLNSALVERGLTDVLPATPLQQGIIFHSIADSADVYTAQFVFELDARVDDERMRRAVSTVLADNPGLRTGFLWSGLRTPVAVVPTVVDASFDSVTVPNGPETAGPANVAGTGVVERLLVAERDRPFRLDTPPLVRFLLIHSATGRTTLALTCHHTILDGWSVPLLVEQLFGAYGTDPSERGCRTHPSPREFLQWRARQDLDAAAAYWAERLRGAEPLCVADLARPGATSDPVTTEQVAFVLPAHQVQGLTDAAARAKVTVSTVAEVATALALGYSCNREDVVFGKTVSGRSIDLPRVDEIVGCLIDTVPVRIALDPADSVSQLLSIAHREHLAGQSAHFLGLGEIQRAAGLGQLFDVLMVFENYPNDLSSSASVLPIESMTAVDATHYPVTIVVDPRDGLAIRADYRPAAVDASFVRGLVDRIALVLSTISDDGGEVDCGEIDLLTPAERHRIVTAWNDTDHEVTVSTLTELVRIGSDRAIAVDPSWQAVVSEDTGYSYAEFAERVARTATELDGLGVRGRIVAVMVPRSPDMVVVLHAIVAAGAAYLPIDPELPQERRDFVLSDAEPAVVIGAVEKGFTAGEFVYLDLGELLARAAVCTPRELPESSSSDTAYVIYTSGSTGRPKGVRVSHGAIVNRLTWMQHEYDLSPKDRVLQKTPTSFDVSVWELFWPLAVGATIVVAEPGGHTDPYYLAGLIERTGITTLHFVPSMLTAFLAATDPVQSASVLRVFCSGEALPAESVARYFDFFEGATPPALHNLYGPTEAAVDVTYWECTRADVTRGVVPIGRPVWNTRLAILDSRLRPVPAGAAGVLYLAGDQLADGYVERSGLTATRFVADPFGPPGARMYDTGDLCRWGRDGAVEYLGRIDNQIKLRGLRIELGEIENVLTGHRSVRAAAVLARTVGSATQLVGYLAPEDDVAVADLDTAAVAEFAAKTLPEYMVPPIFVVLQSLPSSPNGKLDRRALPQPVAPQSAHEEAVGDLEQLVVDLFARVLGRTDVGATDNFFALGGDSISSISLVGRAATAGFRLSPADVFTGRTPRGIATLATPLAEMDIETGPATGPVPVTPIVAAFTELGALRGLHQSIRIRVPADATPQLLSRAVQSVVERHAVLRMRQRPDGGVEILPRGSADLVEVSVCEPGRSLDPRSDGDELDPETGRMLLARWDATRSELTLIAHHLVVDGLSWEPLTADLEQAYRLVGDCSTTAAELEQFCATEDGTTYRHWARSITDDPGSRRVELDHWRSVLALDGSPDSYAIAGPMGTVAQARSLTLEFPEDVSAASTSEIPEMFRCTAQDVLLAGLAAALQEWSGSDSIPIDLEGHGRSMPRTDLSRTVGWFTTLYPVRLRTPMRPWSELLRSEDHLAASIKAVKEQVRATPDNGIGFGALRYLDPVGEQELSRYPLPAVCFNYLGRTGSDSLDILWKPTVIAGGAHPDAGLRHTVEINGAVTAGHLRLEMIWDATVLDRHDVDEIARLWQEAVTAMATLCTDASVGVATPSDLSISGLTQADIDDIEDDLVFE
ncbi:hypothetical protein CH275_06230 [Rhodococcus sp. 06-235-1A]|uniref:non-ribosomal peptide synthetase n=1 Tax=Rhodococcus sp. 06-235-1A TaxID=2022508 RepID=UPI000B9AE266|nr:non-ribosomal peptide synthetase [Rhodococcus sp. 06-235-1A]OZD08144.1 hypothetical protein CH275_06230 [Rhodococcus sp. 06-235-1A]